MIISWAGCGLGVLPLAVTHGTKPSSLARTYFLGCLGSLGVVDAASPPAPLQFPSVAAGSPRDDGDGGGDYEDDAADDAAAHAGSSSSSSSIEFEEKFAAMLGLSADDVPAVYGPRAHRATKRWAGPSTSSVFRPLRRDPCLLSQFERFVSSDKAFFDLASVTMAKSGAASHALLSASSYIERFLDGLRHVLSTPEWPATCDHVDAAMNEHVLAPLRDATSSLADAFGRALSGVRAGVLKSAASSVVPVLRSSPPSGGFFFGNPTALVTSSMNLSALDAIIRRPSSPSSFASPDTPRPSTSSSLRTSARGTAPARSSRGGRGGRRK